MSMENGEDCDVKKEEDDSDREIGYAILTDDFIRAAFESTESCSGVSGLNQEAADALNQDVCYRIREVTHMAAQMMRHGGRQRLSHGDLSRALRWYSAPPVLGHSTRRPLELLAVPEAGVWVAEEHECDLAQLAFSADPPPPPPPADSQLSAHWLAVDGRQPDVKQEADQPAGCLLSAAELAYYEQITRALFGANLELLQIALHDLETSCQLAPVLPHLLRCVLQAIRRLASRPRWMQRLLRVLQALTRNTGINLGSKPNLNHIASALVFCAIEGQPKEPDPLLDPVCVKEFAARLLAQLVYKWTTPVNQLPEQIARTLHDTVQNRGNRLRQQFGAITALTYMGPEAIMRYLCPLLPDYVPAMREVLGTDQLNMALRMDAMRVQSALGLAIQQYLQYKAREFAAEPDAAGAGPPPLVMYRLWAELCQQLAPAPAPACCLSGAPLRQRFPTIYFSFIGASPLPEHLLRRVQFPKSHPFATQAPLDSRPRKGSLRCWPAGGRHVVRTGDLSVPL
ncbi:TAF6-like RNA polymerase II p300/CBP-associated factor-associated factor 65 kDa subunit 6L [Pollicipes pollicipes]|uniref:TAF6-like RNA polymerase II p300/CBP-associated factor-associated factor 65 kDa subunit 6L n=1 Tax=Pollicipes pollicipes TaxID=41117 RepID=UPI0018849696|nr:TAF6-like RNA polymerase II p300/CBP-associated factor-associated factor 65 kDa subunit 6L [Pollicipes pollicipes]